MRNQKILSLLTVPCLLGVAGLLGAFAPIPLMSDRAHDDGIRLPISSVSALQIAADDSTDRDGGSSDNGTMSDSNGAMSADNGTDQTAPDNSANNRGDASGHTLTADQAGDKTADRALMQKIRKAVMADQSLSTYGHNVKIIARHGKVTLKGPVQSDQEKQSIEAKAAEIAGSGNVRDRLTVKAD